MSVREIAIAIAPTLLKAHLETKSAFRSNVECAKVIVSFAKILEAEIADHELNEITPPPLAPVDTIENAIARLNKLNYPDGSI